MSKSKNLTLTEGKILTPLIIFAIPIISDCFPPEWKKAFAGCLSYHI